MTSLSVVSYIERINRMYRLIRKESTGSRAELAGRMRVSERTVSNYLEELRLMGADNAMIDWGELELPVRNIIP